MSLCLTAFVKYHGTASKGNEMKNEWMDKWMNEQTC